MACSNALDSLVPPATRSLVRCATSIETLRLTSAPKSFQVSLFSIPSLLPLPANCKESTALLTSESVKVIPLATLPSLGFLALAGKGKCIILLSASTVSYHIELKHLLSGQGYPSFLFLS